MKLPVPIRLLKDRYFGEASRSEAFAQGRLAELEPYLGPEVALVAHAAVSALVAYQDPDYALLYLQRLARYAGPKKAPCPFLSELAIELDRRMRFDDVAALASRAASADEPVNTAICLADVVEILPPKAAALIAPALSYFRLSRRTILMRFDGTTPSGRKKIETYARLRRMRTYSDRAKVEYGWVERWLHMVDRAAAVEDAAAMEVVRSAHLVDGAGVSYHRGLDRWHAIVETLIRPACNGGLRVSDLATAVCDAVKAAQETMDCRQFERRLVEIIRDATLPALN